MGDIPKRVFLTWKTRLPPPSWQVTMDELYRLMPDWTIVLSSDQDNLEFVSQEYPEFLRDYQNLPYPIMKADVIRYLQLHKYGGFYHDLNICPVKSYQVIIDWIKKCKLTKASIYLVPTPQGGLTNSFMISQPSQDFWYRLVERSFEAVSGNRPWWSDLTKSTYVLTTTGPRLLTKYSNDPNLIILPMGLVNPYNMVDATYHWEQIRDQDPNWYYPGACVRPIPGSSWVNSYDQAIALAYIREPTLFWLVLILALTLVIVWILNRVYE